MRPEILNHLFADIKGLAGIGSKAQQSFQRLFFGNSRLIDLLFYLPIGAIDRTNMPDLTAAPEGVITAVIDVVDHVAGQSKRQPFKAICKNDTGYLTLIFFHGRHDYVKKLLPIGQKRVISGTAERYNGILQISHPDYIVPLEQISKVLITEPIYPITKGISQKSISKAITNALARVNQLPEWLDESLCIKERWNSWDKSLSAVHKISAIGDIEPSFPPRMRLAYDELLANQLALGISRTIIKKQSGQQITSQNKLSNKLQNSLSFTLTAGQIQVIDEIKQDMKSQDRMLRLLQGDVGAGKTIVALLTMLNAIEAGKQCAFMAPTEILARQHAQTITDFIRIAKLDDVVNLQILTGKDKGKSRQIITDKIASNEANLIIGTHALFQESVKFADLGFIVIDEQHKFGVKQRLSLSNKGDNTDILLMTATPIPRTLTLTIYGDIDISILKDKPQGRLPIQTRVMPISRADDVMSGLKRAINQDNQVYWVCPLIEDSEDENITTLATLESRFRELKYLFPNRVGFVHGKLKPDEKKQIMLDFKNGEFDILIATTVIEVGVDVPQATIMVIEHADKFGLSQLHQLRGRIGRGSKESNCILLYSHELSQTGKKRLEILRDTEDGFLIAEEDLLLRGAGEILGTKQSGMPEFKLAIFPAHNRLLLMARDDMKMILQQDPHLKSQRGYNLRILLYLFGYDEHLKNLCLV